jgi:hypothetical protein
MAAIARLLLLVTVIAGGIVLARSSDRVQGGAPAAIMAPTVAVNAASQVPSAALLRVEGFMVSADGETWLCQALARSYPPRCAGASLRVVGANPGAYRLVSTDGVRWSPAPVQVLGTVAEDVLTVALRLE